MALPAPEKAAAKPPGIDPTEGELTEGELTEGELTEGELTEGEARQVADLFRLLGDPGRVRILFALAEAGELRVGDICTAVGAPESSVSHALRLLRTAGIVRNRRDGRNVYYGLDDAHVRLLLELSLEHRRHGDEPEARP